jgi:hypothetical protein
MFLYLYIYIYIYIYIKILKHIFYKIFFIFFNKFKNKIGRQFKNYMFICSNYTCTNNKFINNMELLENENLI